MKLESFRREKGWSQQQLAAALGLRSKGSISFIESGLRPAGLLVALRIQRLSAGRVLAVDLVAGEERELLASAIRQGDAGDVGTTPVDQRPHA